MKASRTAGCSALILQVLLLTLLLLPPAIAQPPQPVRVNEIHNADISLSLSWWPDSLAEADIAEVAEHPERFTPLTREHLHRGYDRAVHWLRVSLSSASAEQTRHWLTVGHPRLQSVTLYRSTPYGWHSQEAGSAVPLNHKPLRTTDAAFPVELAPGEHRTLYIRVRSDTVIDLQTWLWTPYDYLTDREERHLLLMLITGFSFLVAIGTCVAYHYLRDCAFLYFAGLHLSISLLDLARDGLIQRWFWPQDEAFLIQIIPTCAVLALVFMVCLQRRLMPLAVSRHPSQGRPAHRRARGTQPCRHSAFVLRLYAGYPMPVAPAARLHPAQPRRCLLALVAERTTEPAHAAGFYSAVYFRDNPPAGVCQANRAARI